MTSKEEASSSSSAGGSSAGGGSARQPPRRRRRRRELAWRVLVAYTRAPLLLALASAGLEPLWRKRVEQRLRALGLGAAARFAAATCAVHACVYLVTNGGFYLLERLRLLERCRLEHGRAKQPTESLVRRTLRSGLSQVLLGGPVGGLLMYRAAFAGKKAARRLPDVLTLCKSFAAARLWYDLTFYAAHRLLHTRPLYELVHKRHHEWRAGRSIGADFASPLEHLLANAIPSAGAMLLFARHPVQALVWMAFRLEATYEAHSNYCLRGTWPARLGLTHSDYAVCHAAHHADNAGNFGAMHWDAIFGTLDPAFSGGVEAYAAAHSPLRAAARRSTRS